MFTSLMQNEEIVHGLKNDKRDSSYGSEVINK